VKIKETLKYSELTGEPLSREVLLVHKPRFVSR